MTFEQNAAGKKEERYLSVSELSRLMNRLLEESFPQVAIIAEIAECTRAASGHVYLCLKDDKSQLNAVMWRGTAQTLGFKPEEGMSVICYARPNLYSVSGRLQLVIQQMFPAGEGLLKKKFLELKAKLEQEGLFNAARKRPLPFFPRAVGLVTSGTGAVIHDMTVKFSERMPCLPLYLVDVRVQGEGAAQEIAAGIARLGGSGLVDVIIVARGGGSLEDLWAFNEEAVVRAVFGAAVPVISGVGHETDVTLCDLAADVRAPTPTAAAEIVVPKRSELLSRIAEFEQRLRAFGRWLEPKAQRVDDLELALKRRIKSLFEQARLALSRHEARLQSIQPGRLIQHLHTRLDLLDRTLNTSLQRVVTAKRHHLDRLVSKFEAMNPSHVLERGYAIVEARGTVVRSAAEVKKNDQLSIRVARGKIAATVEGTEI